MSPPMTVRQEENKNFSVGKNPINNSNLPYN